MRNHSIVNLLLFVTTVTSLVTHFPRNFTIRVYDFLRRENRQSNYFPATWPPVEAKKNLIWMIEDTRQLICVSHFVLKTHTNRSVSGARAHIRLRHVLLEYSSRSVSWYWSDKTTEWVYNALKIRCNVHMSNGGPLLPERKTRSAFSTWYRNPRTTHTRFCEMWMAQMK